MENSSTEYSESGNPIYRHKDSDEGYVLPRQVQTSVEALEKHIETFFGKPKTVFHELISSHVHIDVHIIEPTPERDYFVLVTTGMSDLPMWVPRGNTEFQFAELLICLPPNWKVLDDGEENVTGNKEESYWPIRALKYLARFPHVYKTWLGPLHTIPNGDPPHPFADNTKLSGIMLIYPELFPKEAWICRDGAKRVNFFYLLPLYTEEMVFKLKKGGETLLEKLDEAGSSSVVDINRRNVCKKRFGIL